MINFKIQQVWNYSYADFSIHHLQSREQFKASHAILNCKTGILGATVSQCSDCGHIEYHNNSCRNRNCPNCQAVKKELWVDKRRAEVIDSPYFHVVFTLPHELNPLLYNNQKLLYGLLHRCCILSGGGITPDRKIRKSKGKFFIPVFVLRDKFKGRFQKFKQRYTGLGMTDLLKQIWKKDICCCPQCGHSAMRLLGRTHGAFG